MKGTSPIRSKQITEICNPEWSLIFVGISCSSFDVKEFDVIVHKRYFLYINNPSEHLAILYPKSLANLVVEVGTRHSHQILLDQLIFFIFHLFY